MERGQPATRGERTWYSRLLVGGGLLVMLVAWRQLPAQRPLDPLAQPVDLRLTNATLDDALRAVARDADVRLSYSSDLLPPSVRVTVTHSNTTVGNALREILRGTGLGLVVAGAGHIVILRASLAQPAAEAMASATAGHSPEGPSATATRVQEIDRVLIMGTPAAGAPERALPTAVSMVTSERIRREHASGMAQQFRSNIPGVVAWDLGTSGPIAQIGSVRGSSSFSANYLKTYLDGVELASPYMLFAMDPDALDRIEVIRGPQGSALYGSDAISGVAHLVSNKGFVGASARPRLEATVQLGSVESAFADDRGVAQHHVLSLSGGTALASYGVTATLQEQGAYVTGARAGNATLIGGARSLRGPLLLETTARLTSIDFTAPVSPLLKAVLGVRAAPRFAQAAAHQNIREQTFGLSAIHEPTQSWRQTLVLGYDRNSGALAPQRNPASVADALLGANGEDARRISVRYGSSLRTRLGPSGVSMLTAGVEFSHLRRERSGASDVISDLPPGAGAPRTVALYVDTANNTGAFAQWKLELNDALFLVAGLRGESNSSFGTGYGTAWAPMAGVSFVRHVNALTLKLRGAYGKGIRPPPPSARRALATREFRQLANPGLAPETQAGFEGGLELYLAGRFSLSATAFDQRAEGLIQHVLPNPRTAPRVLQLQNVGRISNRGIELQARAHVGIFAADASLSTVASQVEALSPLYTGDIRVGDDVPEVPSWSGAAAVSAVRGRVSVTAGVAYFGPWTGYDWLAYYSALVAGETQTTLRSYSLRYPASARPWLVIADDLSPRVSWFARVDNIGNAQRDARDNLQVVAGRTTWLGLRLATR